MQAIIFIILLSFSSLSFGAVCSGGTWSEQYWSGTGTVCIPPPSTSSTCEGGNYDGSPIIEVITDGGYLSCSAHYNYQPVMCADGSEAPNGDVLQCPHPTCPDGSLAPFGDVAQCPVPPDPTQLTCPDGLIVTDLALCPDPNPVTFMDYFSGIMSSSFNALSQTITTKTAELAAVLTSINSNASAAVTAIGSASTAITQALNNTSTAIISAVNASAVSIGNSISIAADRIFDQVASAAYNLMEINSKIAYATQEAMTSAAASLNALAKLNTSVVAQSSLISTINSTLYEIKNHDMWTHMYVNWLYDGIFDQGGLAEQLDINLSGIKTAIEALPGQISGVPDTLADRLTSFIDGESSPLSDAGTAALNAPIPDNPLADPEIIDLGMKLKLPTSSVSGCPAPAVIEVMGSQLTFSYDQLCDWANTVGKLVLILAAIASLRVIGRTS